MAHKNAGGGGLNFYVLAPADSLKCATVQFSQRGIFMTKLLQLLNASNKIALALLLAGLVFFADRTFRFLPFALPDALAGWVTAASVLGACVFVANIIIWCWYVASRGGKGLKRWWKAWTVMNRLDELTDRERLALFWIAYHPEKTISGGRFEDPFNRLVGKGYLIATDPSPFTQGLRVNPRVYARKRKLRDLISKNLHYLEGDFAAPWKG
jgi:hypothetical protein